MKTYAKKSSSALVLVIYLLAFVLMTWSYRAHAADAAPAANAVSPVVVISTSFGDIKVKLNAEKAPVTTENFLHYVAKKQFDGTIFHRVIKTFMIQGGGYTADMTEKPTDAPIKNEANNGLSNLRGTISMARTEDINSATAQFFINVVDNQKLDYQNPQRYGYAVFGEVLSGMDVVDKIRDVKTTNKGDMGDVPVDTVLIKSVRLEGASASKGKKAKGKK